MPPRRLARAVLITSALCLTAPATTLAGTTQESIFQDDELLQAQGDSTRERALDEMAALGVETIHALVLWERIAPNAKSTRRPKVNLADPASYPAASWDRLDGLVRGTTARGMSLILTPTAPIPRWASRCRRVAKRYYLTCKPDPRQFRLFTAALGRRYSGSYQDENGGVLPRVSRWSIWNEPNQGGWLTPQFEKGRPAAPHLYRDLFRQGVAGLQKSGHRRDAIYIGETAPTGRDSGKAFTRPMYPGAFFRELFCLDARGRRLRGSAARVRKCSGRFRKLPATGVTHHPYNRAGFGKPVQRTKRDEIQIGTLSKLEKVLAQGARAKRIRSKPPIYLTEFGFQTNPPDRFAPTPAAAAAHINQSDYLAYRRRSVRGVGQYELIDPPNLATFQTGLRFTDGREKPSYGAYRMPIYVVKSGGGVKVWGQVRPGGSGQIVVIERNGVPVQTITVTNPRGYFNVKIGQSGGTWRTRWNTLVSREATVARR